MGKRMAEARAEVQFSGDILGCYAEHAGCVPQCAIAFEQLLRDAGGSAVRGVRVPF